MDITFSRRTDLALQALGALALDGGRPVARADLARRIGTTPAFLSQVMSPLVRSRWVISERGPGGGYRITGSAFQARMLEVIEATEDPRLEGRCVLREGPCPGSEACPVHEVWAQAKESLLKGLDTIPAVPSSKRGSIE